MTLTASTAADQSDNVLSALAAAEELEALLETEFEHLKAQELDAFEATQSRKNALLQELTQLADIQGPDSADALGPEWDGFKTHMVHCRDLHRRNEVLIHRKIDAIRGALQSLQVQDPTSSVEIYDRLGQLSRMRRGRGYSDA